MDWVGEMTTPPTSVSKLLDREKQHGAPTPDISTNYDEYCPATVEPPKPHKTDSGPPFILCPWLSLYLFLLIIVVGSSSRINYDDQPRRASNRQPDAPT